MLSSMRRLAAHLIIITDDMQSARHLAGCFVGSVLERLLLPGNNIAVLMFELQLIAAIFLDLHSWVKK
jgi:hypothetical protein